MAGNAKTSDIRSFVARISDGRRGDAVLLPVIDDYEAANTESFAMAGGSASWLKVRPDATMLKAARTAAQKLSSRDHHDLSDIEWAATEAIIIPGKRPAFDIVDGRYNADHPLWQHLNTGPYQDNLIRAIPAVGRIELVGLPHIPYGGTGFVVGDGLLMTNRHVAEIFAQGLGTRELHFIDGCGAGLDLKRERGRAGGPVLRVGSVRMIHPWWDMALLEVSGLPVGVTPLTLSVRDARDLTDLDVAVIGYPAYDPVRNNPLVQDQIFQRTYGVKRLQPGRLSGAARTASFGRLVDAVGHECSTLGGNSGSALIDVQTGEVVALHFGGRYLQTNFAVPSFELGLDNRVRDAGVRFTGGSPSTAHPPDWMGMWDMLEAAVDDAPSPLAPVPPSAGFAGIVPDGGRITLDVPLRITIELGTPSLGLVARQVEVLPAPVSPVSPATTERMQEPFHDTDYTDRRGYRPDFIPGLHVPMPEPRDPSLLAPVADGGTELRYTHFSILTHAGRRLPIIAASNVTGELRLRNPVAGYTYTRKALSGLAANDQEKWFPDPRLDAAHQLSDHFYTYDDGAFDKGHVVRREDVAWGETYEELRRANGDTYHVTNCSPQIAAFNQSSRGTDNWGHLENLVKAGAASERLCIFAGPVLDPADQIFLGRGPGRTYVRTQIPRRYWKVIGAKGAEGRLSAFGFMLTQDLSDVPLEFTVTENFRRLLVPLCDIEGAAGILFSEEVRAADMFDSEDGRMLAERGGLTRTRTDAPSPVASPSDVTPHGGDDEAAEEGERQIPDTEAPQSSWRTARSLETLRGQINAMAPGRRKSSDGTIGNAAHQKTNSDHNPWVTKGGFGIVTAMDITHDAAGGCDAGKLAQAIIDSRDSRVKYVIWNRRIAGPAPIGAHPAWSWRPYSGANSHEKHVHISVQPLEAAYDDTSPWRIT